MYGYGNSMFLATHGILARGGTPPANTVAPVISGGTSLGSVLTSTTGTWTGDAPITYSYQWKRNGIDIGSATSSTYTIVVADSAANLTCQVTATNPFGSASAISNTITAQTFTAPVNTVAPVISGTQVVGSSLSTTNGTWTGNPTPTFTYQWYRGATLISGATSSSYTLVQADASNTSNITCQVTGTNSLGSATATSNTLVQIFDFDANAFITSASISDSTQKGAINTLTIDLKGYSIWTKFKAIYPIVGGSASSHAVNLKTPGTYNLTFASGWTHSSTGMTPLNAYADTAFNVNAYRDNNHISLYIRTNVNESSVDMGVFSTAGGGTFFDIESRFSNAAYFGNHIANTYITFTNSDSRGFYINNRTSSTLNNVFLNNTKKGTLTNATTSSFNLNMWIGARNTAGSGSLYSSKQCAFASIGDGLTDAEAANFYTAVQAYQTTLGRQV